MANYMSVSEFAKETGWKRDNVYELARRKQDPLPIHYLKGHQRSGVLIVKETNEWMQRNCCLYDERSAYSSDE